MVYVADRGEAVGERGESVELSLDIEDVKHLERIIRGIRQVTGIREVQRVKSV